MACLRKLQLVAGATLTTTGNSNSSTLLESDQVWIAEIACTGTVTNGGGTLTAKLQVSLDNTNWVDLVTFTAISATSAYEAKYAAAADYLKPLPLYVRASYTITGSTPSYGGVSINFYLGR